MGMGGWEPEWCHLCKKDCASLHWLESMKRSMCTKCVISHDPDFFRTHIAPLGCPVLEQSDGPDIPDGYDFDGFPGGDRRNNVYPTTRESALNALLDFVPEKDRSEIRGMIRDVLDVLDEHSDSDEEE